MWCSVSFRLFIRRGLTCIFCSHAGVGLGTVASISILHSTPSLKPWPSSARSSSQRLATHGPVSKGRHLRSTGTFFYIDCLPYKSKWMFEKDCWVLKITENKPILCWVIQLTVNHHYFHQLYFEIYLKWTCFRRPSLIHTCLLKTSNVKCENLEYTYFSTMQVSIHWLN